MRADYLLNFQVLPDFYEAYFQSFGYTLKPLVIPIEARTFRTTSPSLIVLASPLKYNQTYVYYDEPWAAFLRKEHPDTILLRAGFRREAQGTGYLDLVQPSANLNALMKEAQKAMNQEFLFPKGVADIRKILTRFFDGHGDDSFWATVAEVSQALNMILRRLNYQRMPYHQVKTEVIERYDLPQYWSMLVERLNNYMPFFHPLPFYDKFEEVQDLINQINPYFSSNCKDPNLLFRLSVKDCFEQIKSHLRDIRSYAN